MLRRSACAAALALTLSAPSALAADWTVAEVGDGYKPEVALAPGGNLAVAWAAPAPVTGDDLPTLASRVAGGPFAFTAEESASASWEWLAARPDGRIDAYRVQDEQLERRSRSAGGVFGPRTPVVPGVAMDRANVTVGPGGAVGIGWAEAGAARMRVVLPDGTESVIADATGNGLAPVVVVADDGQAVAVQAVTGGFAHRVREDGTSGAWGAPATVAGSAARVAMNRRGDALLTWREDGLLLKAAYRPAGGAFGPSVELGHAVRPDQAPVPTMGPDGTGIAFVSRENAEHDPELVAARVTAGGVGVVDVLDSTTDPDFPPLAPVATIDADGRAWVAWSRFDGVQSDLYVSRQDIDSGTFSPMRRLDVEGDDVHPSSARISAPGGDRAAVAWDDDDDLVRVAEYTEPERDDEQPPPPSRGGGPVPQQPGSPPPPSPSQPGTPRSGPAVAGQLLSKLAVKRAGRKATVTFTLRSAGRVALVLERRSGRRWRAVRRASVAGRAGANRATLSLKGVGPGRYRVVATTGRLRATKALTILRRGR